MSVPICVISHPVRGKIRFGVPMDRVLLEVVISAVDLGEPEPVGIPVPEVCEHDEALDVLQATVFGES
jgi:hypothetical protein